MGVQFGFWCAETMDLFFDCLLFFRRNLGQRFLQCFCLGVVPPCFLQTDNAQHFLAELRLHMVPIINDSGSRQLLLHDEMV